MVNIFKNIEDYNPNKKQKILNDDMIADMLSNEKRYPIKTELFTRGRKPTLAFTTQYYFAVLKYIRLNSTHYFIMKFPNKQELKQLAYQNSSDIDFQDFISLYDKCTVKPYSFLLTDNTFASDNPSRSRNNLTELM